jgi:hypothetical protein
MFEAGVVIRDLTLENPIRAIREVSHDMTGRRKVRLANGREASSLEIQKEYYGKAPGTSSTGAAVTRSPSGCWTCGSVRCARWRPGTWTGWRGRSTE